MLDDLSLFAPLSAAPYPGLRPFTVDESDIFFGRQDQTEALLNRLDATQFLAVLGPSGCGKSSLVRAGLIAKLEAGLMPRAGTRWHVAEMRPGDRPFLQLSRQLIRLGVVARNDEPVEMQAVRLEASLRQGPLALGELLAAQPAATQARSLLLLVDQFEEIFRYHREKDSDEADAFVALLLASVQRAHEGPPWDRIYVVVTMRSDFVGDCMVFMNLPEAINGGQYLVPRLTRAQIREAIDGPARLFGSTIEDELVKQLLNEVGSQPDQLPLLQHALMRLWRFAGEGLEPDSPRSLGIALYRKRLGSLGKALDDHAEEALSEVTDRVLAQILFCTITGSTDGRHDVRRPSKVEEVVALAPPGTSWQAVVKVAEPFRPETRHFLLPPGSEVLREDSYLDIGHESLIRNWKRLAAWAEQEAADAAELRRAVDAGKVRATNSGDLWGASGLERSSVWRRRPAVAAWAGKYVSADDYAIADAFLNESDRELHRAEQQAQKRRRRRRLEAALLAFVALAGLVGFGIFRKSTLDEMQAAVERERNLARQEKAAADSRIGQAKIREAQAVESAKDAALAIARLAEEAERQRTDAERDRLVQEARLKQINDQLGKSARMQSKVLVSEASSTPDPRLGLGLALEAERLHRSDRVVDFLRRRYASYFEPRPLPEASDTWNGRFFGDGQYLFTLRKDETPQLYGTDTLKSAREVFRYQWSDAASTAVGVGPTGILMARAFVDGKRSRVVVHGGPYETPPSFELDQRVVALFIDARNRHVVALGDNGAAALHVLQTGETRALKAVGKRLRAVAFHPKEPVAVLGGDDGRLLRLDLAAGGSEAVLETGATAAIHALTFSADGKRLFDGRYDDRVRVWAWGNDGLTRVAELEGHVDTVTSICASDDGSLAASVGDDRVLRIWSVNAGVQLQEWAFEKRQLRDMRVRAGQVFTLWNDAILRVFTPVLARGAPTEGQIDPALEAGYVSFDAQRQAAVATLQVNSATVAEATRMRRLARLDAAGETALIVDTEDRAFVVDTRRPALRRQIDLPGSLRVSASAISADGSHVAIGASDGAILIYAVDSGKLLAEAAAQARDAILVLSFAPRGAQLAWADGGGRVGVLDSSGRNDLSPQRQLRRVRALAWSPDGAQLASGSDDGRVRLWTVRGAPQAAAPASSSAPRATAELTTINVAVVGVSMMGDGSVVFVGSDGSIRRGRVGSVEYQELVRAADFTRSTEFLRAADLLRATSASYLLALSPDRKTLASVADSGLVRLLPVDGSGPVREWRSPAGERSPIQVGWSANGELVILGQDLRVLRRPASAGTELPLPPSLALAPLLPITGPVNADTDAVVLSLTNGAVLHRLRRPAERAARHARLGDGGRRLATLDADRTVRLFELPGGLELARIVHPEGAEPTMLAISEDGTRLAAGFQDGSIAVYDHRLKRQWRGAGAHADAIRALAFDAGGERLASGGADGFAQIWKATELTRPLHRIDHSKQPVTMLAFSRRQVQEELLTYAGGSGAEVRLRRWEPGKVPARMEFSPGAASIGVSLSPDQRMFLMSEPGGRIRLNSVTSGFPVAEMRAPTPRVPGPTGTTAPLRVARVAFGPDDDALTVVYQDGSMRRMPCPACANADDVLKWARDRNHKLTEAERAAVDRALTE